MIINELQSHVTLEYGDTFLTLPTPLHGDLHELITQRVQAESVDGDLLIYADPNWNKLETFRLQFDSVTTEMREAFFTFLQESLGQVIIYHDYNGHSWEGLIINPDQESHDLIPDGCGHTLAFDFTILGAV